MEVKPNLAYERPVSLTGGLLSEYQIKGIVFPNPEDIYSPIPVSKMEVPSPPPVPISVHQPTPATPPNLPTNVTDSGKFYSGLQQNCSYIGSLLALGGFLLCFFAGFFFVQDLFMGIFVITGRGWMSDEVALILFYFVMGIGGFMVSTGPILLVVSWVLPTMPKPPTASGNGIYAVGMEKLTGCGWLVSIFLLFIIFATLGVSRLISSTFGFWWGIAALIPLLIVVSYLCDCDVRNNPLLVKQSKEEKKQLTEEEKKAKDDQTGCIGCIVIIVIVAVIWILTNK